jgi:hypothetical protein
MARWLRILVMRSKDGTIGRNERAAMARIRLPDESSFAMAARRYGAVGPSRYSAKKEAPDAVCQIRNPATGDKLTRRQKQYGVLANLIPAQSSTKPGRWRRQLDGAFVS